MIEKKALIIPGPRKCGTTTLYSMIAKHNSIDSSEIKEPMFFALPRDTVKDNIQWYKSLYSTNKDKILLDGSTLYFSSKRAAKNIKEFFKNVKILIILRDPAKRTFSSYFQMRKSVPCHEKREFNTILKNMKGGNNQDIIKSENSLLKKDLKRGLIDEHYLDEDFLKKSHGVSFKSFFEDRLWVYKYFQGSIYSEYVTNYRKLFKKNLKIVIFEELLKNTEEVMNNIWEFIGVNSIKNELIHVNKTLIPNNLLAKRIEKFSKSKLGNKTSSLIKNFNLQRVSSNIINTFYDSKPKISENQYLKIRTILNEEYQYWLSKNSNIELYWNY